VADGGRLWHGLRLERAPHRVSVGLWAQAGVRTSMCGCGFVGPGWSAHLNVWVWGCDMRSPAKQRQRSKVHWNHAAHRRALYGHMRTHRRDIRT